LKVLISIPLLTLFERKILSYSQNRKGPKKVSVGGILQPIGDGVKLVLKKFAVIFVRNKFRFVFLPFLSFLFMCFCWKFYPFFLIFYRKMFSILVILCISSLAVYIILFSGWSRNSKYSLIGSIRGAAQNISYEISLIIIILSPCCLGFSLKLKSFLEYNNKFFFLLLPLFVVWIIKCIAELNRAPFDFAEGESELVSGFNTEYSGLKFAFFFFRWIWYDSFFKIFIFNSFFFQKILNKNYSRFNFNISFCFNSGKLSTSSLWSFKNFSLKVFSSFRNIISSSYTVNKIKFICLVFCRMFLLALEITKGNCKFIIKIDFIFFKTSKISFRILLDKFSLLFAYCLLLIVFSVFSFSNIYMLGDVFFKTV